jgi:hypothetical protein
MDKALAREFALKYKEFSTWFNAMTELSARIDDVDQAKALRRKLAEMLFALDDTIFIPLKKQHPDLFDPT